MFQRFGLTKIFRRRCRWPVKSWGTALHITVKEASVFRFASTVCTLGTECFDTVLSLSVVEVTTRYEFTPRSTKPHDSVAKAAVYRQSPADWQTVSTNRTSTAKSAVSVLLTNFKSILNKLHKLKALLSSCSEDILIATETWLLDDISNLNLTFPHSLQFSAKTDRYLEEEG